MTSSEAAVTVAAVRAAVTHVAELLEDLSPSIYQVPNGQLGDVVGELGQLRAVAEAGMVVATAEGVSGSLCKAGPSFMINCP